MVEFYKQALKKIDKLDANQLRALLISAVGEINLLANVSDSFDVGILVCDEKHNLVMVNKYAQWLLPMNYYKGGELFSAIGDSQISQFFRETLLNRDRVMDREIDLFHKGRKWLLSVNILPLVQERRITGSLIYIEDITEKRLGEARLRRAETLASLTTLAAGVAHEIKNPLGSISIHLQLLQKALEKTNSVEVNTGKYFDVIKEEVDRLNRIVVDFLFAVRPMQLELREGDVNKLISQMIKFVRYEMEQSHITCRMELDENLPRILMDERFMKQALLNLITNARSAMPDGGIFTIATRHIDHEIVIYINDTGTGINEKHIPKIFEPYFTTRETGTGLGLTQVYKIIKEHQGEINVSSKSGEGTGFEIILPVPQKERRMIAYTVPEGEVI